MREAPRLFRSVVKNEEVAKNKNMRFHLYIK